MNRARILTVSEIKAKCREEMEIIANKSTHKAVARTRAAFRLNRLLRRDNLEILLSSHDQLESTVASMGSIGEVALRVEDKVIEMDDKLSKICRIVGLK